MDPTVLFSEAAKLGFGVLALTFAVVCLWRRDNAMQVTDRARTDKAIADQAAACAAREEKMAERIRHLEDRDHEESKETTGRVLTALETTARVLEKLTDNDSGLHLALNGKNR